MELYQYQGEAYGLLKNTKQNLLIIAPTGAGKTQVGYEALRFYGKGIYVAPTRALCKEKFDELRALFPQKRIVLGNKDYSLGQKSFRGSDFRVITPWKLNQLLQNGLTVEQSPVVVIDEVHNLPSEIEIIITKLKEMQPEIRLIGLSATVSREDEAKFAAWQNAVVVKSEDRPVPLVERVVFFDVDLDDEGNELTVVKVYENGSLIAHESVFGELKKNSHLEILYKMIREEERDESPVLWFSPYRARAAQIAGLITELADNYDGELADLAGNMSNQASEFSPELIECLPRQAGFHHGGLSQQERELVQDLAVKGKLKNVATCFTLTQGVNLPARHVVLDTIYDYGKGDGAEKRLLDITMFRQLEGRAGRPQFDTIGYCWIPVFSEVELVEVQGVLLKYKASKLESRIFNSYFLTATLPQLVYAGFNTAQKIAGFIKATYWGKCMQDTFPLTDQVQSIVGTLIDSKVVRVADGQMELTFAGNQIARLGLHPDEYFIIDGLVNKTDLNYENWIENLTRVTANYVIGVEASDRLETCLEELKTYGFAVFTADCKHYTRDMADYLSRLLEITRSYLRLNRRMDDYEEQWEKAVAENFLYGQLYLAKELSSVLHRDQLKRLIRNLGSALINYRITDEPTQRTIAKLLFSHSAVSPNGMATKVAEIIGMEPDVFKAMAVEEMAKRSAVTTAQEVLS